MNGINQIKIGAILSYVGLFVNILIGLVYTPWMIKTIGSSDYGLYTLAMSIIGLLAFDFGLGNATNRFVSKYLAEGRQDKVDNFLGLIYKLYLIVDSLIFIVLLVIYFRIPQIYTGLTDIELSKFYNVFIIAALFCIISFPFVTLNGILTSYEKFVPLKLCDIFHKVLIVLLMLFCLLNGGGVMALVTVNAVAGIITILLKLWVVKRKTPLKVTLQYWEHKELKTIFSFTMWVTIAALAQRLIFNISPSILGILSDSTSIAILGVAITLESYVYLFANALNGMFLPKVSRMLNQNDADSILELMIKVGRVQIYVIGFIVIWLVSFGNHFINVWVGNDYSLVYPCCLLIILPSFLHLPQEIGLTYIIASNKVKKQAIVYIFMGVLNILLSIPFTILWGVKGMCLSIFIAYVVRTVGLDVIFKRELHLDIKRFFIESYIRLLPLLIVALAGSLLINYVITISGWIGLVMKSVCCLAFFLLLCVCCGFNDFEKSLFIQPLASFFKRK